MIVLELGLAFGTVGLAIFPYRPSSTTFICR